MRSSTIARDRRRRPTGVPRDARWVRQRGGQQSGSAIRHRPIRASPWDACRSIRSASSRYRRRRTTTSFGYLREDLNYKQSVLAGNVTGDLFEGFGAGAIQGGRRASNTAPRRAENIAAEELPDYMPHGLPHSVRRIVLGRRRCDGRFRRGERARYCATRPAPSFWSSTWRRANRTTRTRAGRHDGRNPLARHVHLEGERPLRSGRLAAFPRQSVARQPRGEFPRAVLRPEDQCRRRVRLLRTGLHGGRLQLESRRQRRTWSRKRPTRRRSASCSLRCAEPAVRRGLLQDQDHRGDSAGQSIQRVLAGCRDSGITEFCALITFGDPALVQSCQSPIATSTSFARWRSTAAATSTRGSISRAATRGRSTMRTT